MRVFLENKWPVFALATDDSDSSSTPSSASSSWRSPGVISPTHEGTLDYKTDAVRKRRIRGPWKERRKEEDSVTSSEMPSLLFETDSVLCDLFLFDPAEEGAEDEEEEEEEDDEADEKSWSSFSMVAVLCCLKERPGRGRWKANGPRPPRRSQKENDRMLFFFFCP